MHRGITGALLGCFLWMLGSQAAEAEWFKVPPGGQVTFTLSEYWGIHKAPPPDNLNNVDASLTLEYADGTTQLVAFQDSGPATWSILTGIGLGEIDGTSTWTQTASLPEGSVFRIVYSSPAEQYDIAIGFQGGQEGAYIKGLVTKFSTNAPPVTSPSGPSTSNLPPPSLPGGANSNIHAVVVSGLSDPAKVIVSSNLTLTGGIVALGKNASPQSTPSAWSPGLKIIPDYGLLTGEKIPPVTPNIIDVRIVRQEVTAGFPSPSTKPDN